MEDFRFGVIFNKLILRVCLVWCKIKKILSSSNLLYFIFLNPHWVLE